MVRVAPKMATSIQPHERTSNLASGQIHGGTPRPLSFDPEVASGFLTHRP